MEGPRTPMPSEFESLVDFLNQNLRSDLSWPIHTEYPTALSLNNIHNMSIITDEESKQIISHALVKPLIMRSAQANFKLAAIGSVVTSPEYRNQGLSSKNISNCLEIAHQQNCDLAILWSDKFDYYKKFSFEPTGFEFTYQVSPTEKTANFNNDLRYMKSTKVDPAALLKLYTQHTVGCVRTSEDFQKYLTIPNMNVFTAWGADNQIKAYAIEGKGADLQGFVHDWGGGVSAMLDLLKWIVSTENRATTIMTPRHAMNMRKQLLTIADFEHQGVLGLVKILNFESVCTKLKSLFRSDGFERIVFEKQGQGILFGYNNDLYTLDRADDLSRLIFGPTLVSDFDFIKPETRKILETKLPMPLWVWGWDSI